MVYEMTAWYSQYSKKIKAFALRSEAVGLQVENAIIQKVIEMTLNIATILSNLKSLFIQIYENDVLNYLIKEKWSNCLFPIRFK